MQTSVEEATTALVDLRTSPCAVVMVQEYTVRILKPSPVRVTDDGKDASISTGAADVIRSITLISTMPPSLSTDMEVTESTTLRIYLPPEVRAVEIGQEKKEDDTADDTLLMTTEGSVDEMNRQI
jgi:hypothetical protein